MHQVFVLDGKSCKVMFECPSPVIMSCKNKVIWASVSTTSKELELILILELELELEFVPVPGS